MKRILKFFTLALLGGALLTAPAGNAAAGTFLEDVGESAIGAGGGMLSDAGNALLKAEDVIELLEELGVASAKTTEAIGHSAKIIGRIIEYAGLAVDAVDLTKAGLAGDREAFRAKFNELLRGVIGLIIGKVGAAGVGLIAGYFTAGIGAYAAGVVGGIAAELLANWAYDKFFPIEWVNAMADWLYDTFFAEKDETPPTSNNDDAGNSSGGDPGGGDSRARSPGNGNGGSGNDNPEIEDVDPLPPSPPQVDPRRRRGIPVYNAPSSLPSGGQKLEHNAF
jgi:hypothetical protein